MGLSNAANLFRKKADTYLAMISYAGDERQRRILHKLFEENEKKADAFETKAPSSLSWTSQSNS
jgi:hypothetical protein